MSSPPQRPPRRAAPPTDAAPTPIVPNLVQQLVEEQAAENERAGFKPAERPAPASPSNGSSGLSSEGYHTKKVVIEHDYEQNGPGTFTTLTGVILSIKSYPNEAEARIRRNMLPDRPKPPRTYNNSDDKWTTHEDDPDYIQALRDYHVKDGEVGFFVRATLATKLRSIPEDGSVYPVDSEEWSKIISDPDLYGEYGVKVHPVGSPHRYIDWLQYYVLGEGDIRELYRAIDHASGVIREEVVKDAMRSFPDNG